MARSLKKILIAVLLSVLALSLYGILKDKLYQMEGDDSRDQAQELLNSTDTTDTEPLETLPPETAESTGSQEIEPQPTDSETTETAEELPPEPDDYVKSLLGKNTEALKATSSNAVGWIEIPGTTVSYPLMQYTDNEHYLSYSWDGKYNPGGAIFLDYRSNPSFADFHTIIYGHRMYHDAMFNSLKHYSSEDYAKEHPSVYIVLDDRVLRYDIFAAYDADAINGHSYRLGLKDAEGQQKYINYCLNRTVINTGIKPASESGDQVLTLSTCSADGGEKTRWVTHWVLGAVYEK